LEKYLPVKLDDLGKWEKVEEEVGEKLLVYVLMEEEVCGKNKKLSSFRKLVISI
jgi:hypothetical protein